MKDEGLASLTRCAKALARRELQSNQRKRVKTQEKILSILINQENPGSENGSLMKVEDYILEVIPYFINSIFPIFENLFDSNLYRSHPTRDQTPGSGRTRSKAESREAQETEGKGA